jgi:hypothetical protein
MLLKNQPKYNADLIKPDKEKLSYLYLKVPLWDTCLAIFIQCKSQKRDKKWMKKILWSLKIFSVRTFFGDVIGIILEQTFSLRNTIESINC